MCCCNCVWVHVCMCTCANVFLQWCQWCFCDWACASVYPRHLLHLHTCVITHMKRAYLSNNHAMQHPVPCITRALALDLTLLPFHLKLALCLLVSNPCVSWCWPLRQTCIIDWLAPRLAGLGGWSMTMEHDQYTIISGTEWQDTIFWFKNASMEQDHVMLGVLHITQTLNTIQLQIHWMCVSSYTWVGK